MIHCVTLSEPPADFQVPDDLKERFWYDGQRKRLCFDGFMSKCTYDRLLKLSWDVHYRRALEGLFRSSIPEEETLGNFRRRKVAIVLITVAGLVAAGGLAVRLVTTQ